MSAAEIEQDAARWLLRREEPLWSEDDDKALTDWLDQSMAHRAAFWRLEHGWQAADRVAAIGPSNTLARRRLRFGNIMNARPNVSRLALAASIALVAVAGGGAWWMTSRGGNVTNAVADYQTPVGGQRTIRLADGSQVQMNTATALRTATTGEGREVWLDEGEAFFDIAHRTDRQFVVHAGPRTITVLGTRFVVRRQADKVTIAVLSGRVRVDDTQTPETAATPARSIVVSTGDIAVTQPRATLVTTDRPAQVEAISAWRDGMILFDDTRLADAATEFNRYGARPIRVVDPGLANLRIGGSFRIGDSRAFVALMQRAYRIRVRQSEDAIVLER